MRYNACFLFLPQGVVRAAVYDAHEAEWVYAAEQPSPLADAILAEIHHYYGACAIHKRIHQ